MSSDTLHPVSRHAASSPLRRTARICVELFRSTAFWVAVILPLVYLPMIALGLATAHPSWFVGLLGTNALALVLGHGHGQPS